MIHTKTARGSRKRAVRGHFMNKLEIIPTHFVHHRTVLMEVLVNVQPANLRVG